MRVKICNKYWQLNFTHPKNLPKNADGVCTYDANGIYTETNKKILISENLKNKDLLETIIHEVLHAADLTKDELWIETVSKDLAIILNKLGYIKCQKKTHLKS